MKKILFKGAGSAVPTPFDENGGVPIVIFSYPKFDVNSSKAIAKEQQ